MFYFVRFLLFATCLVKIQRFRIFFDSATQCVCVCVCGDAMFVYILIKCAVKSVKRVMMVYWCDAIVCSLVIFRARNAILGFYYDCTNTTIKLFTYYLNNKRAYI